MGRPDVPQSWNRYSYCVNDPVNLSDPTGMFITFANRASENLFNSYFGGAKISEEYKNDIINLMADPEVDYRINYGGTQPSKVMGGRTYVEGPKGINRVNVQVYAETSSDYLSAKGRLAHELRHAVQFYKGQVGFKYVGKNSGEWKLILYDITDEFEAFDAQIAGGDPFDAIKCGEMLRKYGMAKTKQKKAQALGPTYLRLFDLFPNKMDHPSIGFAPSGYYFTEKGEWYHIP